MNNEKFYNYKYWREVQRNQLTITSNIIFTFCVAIIAFIVDYLLKERYLICPIIKNLFFLSILCFLFSIISYLLMNLFKLNDYRLTAKLIRQNSSEFKIRRKTSLLGIATWYSFYSELFFAFLGFSLTLFTFYNIIF